MIGKSKTSTYKAALDGIVHMNFPLAVAVLICVFVTGHAVVSLQQPSCSDKASEVILTGLFSLGWFLFSAFIAQSLKMVIKLSDPCRAINPKVLTIGLFGSVYACFMGCVLLMLFIGQYVEMKARVVSCGVKYTSGLVAMPLVAGVVSSFVYFIASCYVLLSFVYS